MTVEALGSVKDALNEYHAALESRMGLKAKRERLVNVLVNNADDLVRAVEMTQGLVENLNAALDETERLKAELDALKDKGKKATKE